MKIIMVLCFFHSFHMRIGKLQKENFIIPSSRFTLDTIPPDLLPSVPITPFI